MKERKYMEDIGEDGIDLKETEYDGVDWIQGAQKVGLLWRQ
jgi:hypothetical protein